MISVFLTGTLLFFNSCSNDNAHLNVQDSSTLEVKNSSFNFSRVNIETPENTENPHDEIGVMHNIIISEVMSNTSNLITTDDYINYAKEVSYNIYGIDSTNTVLSTNTQIKNVISNYNNNFNNVVANSNFSTNGKQILGSFIDIMLTADRNENMDFNTLKGQIINFELDLINNFSISENEKQNILQVTSIARHSTYFWYNIMLDAIEYNDNLEPNAARRSWWKWVAVGVADALGGIAGATVGTPTGIAAVGAAVVGAASASGGTVTVLDYFWPDPVNVPPSE